MGFIVLMEEIVNAYRIVYGDYVKISDSSSNGTNLNGLKNGIHYDPADLLFQSFKEGYSGNLLLALRLEL